DKDNAMPGRIATAPLDLVIGNYKTLSVFDVTTLEWFVVAFVSDDGDVLIVLHFITVCPISVTLAAARAGWVVRLLQFTEPLSDQCPIDQGHVPVPWKRKRQTLPPPKPTVRTSALGLKCLGFC